MRALLKVTFGPYFDDGREVLKMRQSFDVVRLKSAWIFYRTGLHAIKTYRRASPVIYLFPMNQAQFGWVGQSQQNKIYHKNDTLSSCQNTQQQETLACSYFASELKKIRITFCSWNGSSTSLSWGFKIYERESAWIGMLHSEKYELMVWKNPEHAPFSVFELIIYMHTGVVRAGDSTNQQCAWRKTSQWWPLWTA